jgi:2-dehydro-3-deoxyphosphogluconate aldolase/(4S)-4-hydroxy-2-oxoglutarate aldolase
MTETTLRPAIPDAILASHLIAIGRRLDPAGVEAVAAALLDGGVRAFELTLDGAAALDGIASLARRFSSRELLVGAGTVLDIRAAQRAADAGAAFLVMPHTDLELIRWAAEHGLPAFPGAFSPTDVLAGWRAGAAAIKVFPASVVGPDFVRELHGPFRDIPLVPTGGVTIETAAAFLEAGAVAVGMGSWLTGSGDPTLVRQRATEVIAELKGRGR